jgi:hypothetical protein
MTVESSPEQVELLTALDHLDEVFRGIEPPADPGGCDFCWPNGWDVLLGPVVEVPEGDLVSFAMEGPDSARWSTIQKKSARLRAG